MVGEGLGSAVVVAELEGVPEGVPVPVAEDEGEAGLRLALAVLVAVGVRVPAATAGPAVSTDCATGATTALEPGLLT